MANNRYAKGKFYRLVNDIDSEFYVGSTCSTLAKRLSKHKNASKRKPDRKVYQHINSIGWENVSIILIEEYPCENKMELERRERYWIEELKPTLNRIIPTRTGKEWRVDNAEKLCEYIAKYSAENAEKLREYRANYYTQNKDKVRESQENYKANNLEKVREYQKQYQKDNADKFRAALGKYRDANRDAINARERERRALKKQQAVNNQS